MPASGLLVVNSSNSWGGNEFWSLRVAKGMADRGHPVRFAWSHRTVGDRAQEAGLDCVRIPLRNDLDVSSLFQLRREMAKHRPHAVLMTRWREYLLGGIAARMSRIPRTVMRLGLNYLPADDLKRRITFGVCDRILVNAPEIRETLLQRSWITADKVKVVINGVDLDRFRPRWESHRAAAGESFRKEFGIPEDVPLLLNIGNLSDQKDQANLLRACALARDSLPDLRLLIIGEGHLREELEAMRDELGLADAVLMPGFINDVLPPLAAADLFVLSSDNEGMARVLIEAAASGLPIVTTDVSGAAYCVLDGESGRVVPPQDAEALKAGILDAMADSSRALEFGRRARQLAEERFDVERMLDETAAVLFE